MKLLSVVPSFDESVADRVARSLVGAEIVKVESRASKRVFHMINDGALN